MNYVERLTEIDAKIIALKEERRTLMEAASRTQDILLLKDNIQILEDRMDRLSKATADRVANRTSLARQGIEIHGKLRRSKAEMNRLLNRKENSADEVALLRSLEPRLTEVAHKLVVEVFNVDPNKVDSIALLD